MNELALFLQTAVQMGTPILFATIGGILSEKAGNLNLGIEGMMLMGAVMGFKVALATGNPVLAMLAAFAAASLGALIYAIITVTFRGNQIVTGLTLTIFGTGLANFIGKELSSSSLPASIPAAFSAVDVPALTAIPILGKALFNQNVYIYLGLLIAVLCYIYLEKTRLGLNLRSVGENPGAADASGVNVTLYKYLHIVFGGGLCGLGGAYTSLVFIPRWQENITAGMGWIAVVLIIFSTWNPLKAVFGAFFFGALRSLGFKLQQFPIPFTDQVITVPSQLLDMIPYLATIIVLVLITLRNKKENQPPEWLGIPYFREDR